MRMSIGHVGRWLFGLAFTSAALMSGGAALAEEPGQPAPWAMTLRASASPVMDSIRHFHNGLQIVITVITLFVMALLLIVIVRFNSSSNRVPSRTTHNTMIEVAWTLIPVRILVSIAVPSFRLFEELDIPKPDMTVKVTGKQWYWSYAYPDNGNFEFDLSCWRRTRKPRMLGVDNELVVPMNKVVRVEVTGGRRHPFVRDTVVWHQDRCDPWPSQRNLVQGHQDRHVLRPVLGTVRSGSRLHADRGAGGERSGFCDLG